MDNPTATLDLKDIHLPDPLSWWPLAPGWWIILGIVWAITLLGWFFWRYKQRTRLQNVALAELDQLEAAYGIHQDSHRLTGELSALLRRVCLAPQGVGQPLTEQPGVAGLSGTAWLNYLDHDLAGRPFTQGVGRWLIEQPFQRLSETAPPLPPEEMTALLALCRSWLRIHTLPRRRVRSTP